MAHDNIATVIKTILKSPSYIRGTAIFTILVFGTLTLESKVVKSHINSQAASTIILYSSKKDASPSRYYDYAIYCKDSKGKTRRINKLQDSSFAPSFSPDGRMITYMSIKNGKRYKICVTGVDGIGEKVLTSNSGRNQYPSFSPDGRKILYTSQLENSSRIFIMSLDGRNQHPVTPSTLDASQAVFSPDGIHIVFSARLRRSAIKSNSSVSLYKIALDGSNLKRLTLGDSPSFSNNGRKIVFLNNGIQVMNADGSKIQRITLGGSGDDDPSFSPDDKFILFSSLPSRRSARAAIFSNRSDGEDNELYSVTVNGEVTRRLTYGKGNKLSPTWNPKAPTHITASLLSSLPQSLIVSKIAGALDNQPLVSQEEPLRLGYLIYAFNDLKRGPYPSFLLEQKGRKTSAFRIRGLQGTEGDLVFDPLVLPGGDEVLVKLGDPVPRPGNPYNSYRLWSWNRRTNAFTQVGTRPLFFPALPCLPMGAAWPTSEAATPREARPRKTR